MLARAQPSRDRWPKHCDATPRIRMPKSLNTAEYISGVRAGDRRTLARAITLVESTRPDHAQQAQEVLQALSSETGHAVRIGITGVPGVGKSTFIEALGNLIVDQGKRLAVLAIDPSSSLSGGSILGDKTRMDTLSRHPKAFIRPSPGAGTLGGVARRTREAMLLCEAAGFDVIFIETIGVGQSETSVADMVDTFLLLMLAGAGDDLQGIKRGIMEMADLLVITKADGDNRDPALQAAQQYEQALHILQSGRAGGAPRVLTCSAVAGTGLDTVWQALASHREEREASGALEQRRNEQALGWFERTVVELLQTRFFEDPSVAKQIPELRAEVAAGRMQATTAALKLFQGRG